MMTSSPASPSGRQTLRVAKHFDEPAERVFDAWVDPSIAGRWLFATPAGQIVRCNLDARSGGQMTIVDRRDGENVEHTGVYEEVSRPSRLVFRFGVPKYSAETSRVVIDIAPAAAGGCDLSLTHEEVLPEWADSTVEGWRSLLQALVEMLAGRR